MLTLVLRRIVNNKWLMTCLLLGMILAVAMVSSIPLYTNGILQRMLTKDLEQYQTDKNKYPGLYEFELDIYQFSRRSELTVEKIYDYFNGKIDGQFIDDLGIELAEAKSVLTINYLYITPEEQRGNEEARITGDIYALQGYAEHFELISGRMPEKETVDGVYECLIMQEFQKSYDIILDRTYIVKSFTDKDSEEFLVKPVGLVSYPDNNDLWWVYPDEYTTCFILDYDLVKNDFISEGIVTDIEWQYLIDYTKINIEQVDDILYGMNEQEEFIKKYSSIDVKFRAEQILEDYSTRKRQLTTTLLVLQVPILIMLAFYLFMTSQLVVENDKNEISILKSRGSSRAQILAIYFVQSLLFAAVSVAIGLIAGVWICKVLGASNGFLEFVSRSALPIKMIPRAILYAIITGLFSVVVMMIPVAYASRISIVELKQKKARKWKAPFWQKIFLDVILLAGSLYGLNAYKRSGQTRMIIEGAGKEAPIDPFMFIILTLFILGIGLLFLRIYPLIIKGIYYLGKKIWSPVLYSSFIQVGRSSGRQQFLMLFLILTMSVGIFSANAARTINLNIEDKVYYEIGCDISLMSVWQSNEVSNSSTSGEEYLQEDTTADDEPVIYIEPPFSVMENITGVASAAKVYRPDNVKVRVSEGTISGALMAIIPDQFGNTTWENSTFLPYHINEYLNLMTYSANAVIVSEAYREEKDIELGDSISYYWSGQSNVEGVVVAFAEYWPGINPYSEDENQYFIVANLNYVQSKTALEPYEVWLKLDDDTTSSDIYSYIEENNIGIEWVKNAKQEMVSRKNDPLLQGTNGAMTLGFIVTMAISALGFIIYWILSIRSRALQFGIFRAIGMTKANILAMIAIEQVLISIITILVGIIIGGISSQLFMPLLNMISTAAQQVPPFRIVASRQDYYKIYAVVGFMIIGGFAVIGAIVSKIKVDQVLKLGED